MENLSVVQAQGEVPLLAEILSEGSRYKLEHGDRVWDDGWSQQEVEDYLGNSTPYLIKAGHEVVGEVWMQWQDEELWGERPPDAGYMHRLVIRDGYHGQGLGGQIVDWAAGLAAEQGRKFLRLDCPVDNLELCAYYEGLGFTRVEEKYMPSYGYAEALYERQVA